MLELPLLSAALDRIRILGDPRRIDVVVIIAIARFALQFATAKRYGIFSDELYYLACAQHLQAGYVDQPPLIAVVTWTAVHLFGTSLFGLRFLPAVASGLLVWLTGRIAREMGGRTFAQGLAALAVACAPIYLMLHHWLTMNAFEPLLWMAAVWLTMRMVRTREPRLWLVIGLVCGVGMENKYTMILPVAGIAVGLLLTPHRGLFKSWWLIGALAVGTVVFLPNLIWLFRHHFPFLEFERNTRVAAMQFMRPPLAFVADQIMIMNPLSGPLWLGGLAWLLLAKDAQPVRFLGWVFLTIFLVLLILKAKNYYVTPAYPMLFAAGGVAFENWSLTKRQRLRGAYAGAVLISGLILAPFVVPVLSLETFLAYQRALGGFRPVVFERAETGPLPL